MQKDRSLVRTCVEEVSVSKICIRDHVRNRSDAERIHREFQKNNRKENRRLVTLTGTLYIIKNYSRKIIRIILYMCLRYTSLEIYLI